MVLGRFSLKVPNFNLIYLFQKTEYSRGSNYLMLKFW